MRLLVAIFVVVVLVVVLVIDPSLPIRFKIDYDDANDGEDKRRQIRMTSAPVFGCIVP